MKTYKRTVKKKMIFWVLSVCLFCSLFFCVPGDVSLCAAEKDYIRVGLKDPYGGVEQIKIENTALDFGYCIDHVFYPSETLYSENGFSFRADSSSYCVLKGEYTSYASAVAQIALLKAYNGITAAFPASVGKGRWKIYVSGSISGTLTEQVRKSEHMILVGTKNSSFLIDAEISGSYPQFAAKAGNGSVPVISLKGGYSYRGRMEIGRYCYEGVTAVNVLPMEEYLYGVVPSEMVHTWPAEALKAQAVCARGYALLTTGVGSSGDLTKGYWLSNTTLHQVYKGYGMEQKETNWAVDATRGETVCYRNQVVKTYYFSTSGGSTEAIEDVWGGNISWLRGVSDLYETTPSKRPWIISLTKREILSRLQDKGREIGNVVNVEPVILTQSGRVYSLRITGTTGSVTLEKDQIRTTLGLYSTKFKVIKNGDIPDMVSVLKNGECTQRRISDSYIINGNYQVKKADASLEQYVVLSADNRSGFALKSPDSSDTFLFAGMGYGHGVGMSQSGARGMAEAGYSYKEILEHYFTGTKVQ